METNRFVLIIIVACALITGCTSIEYNNPLDSRGSAYQPVQLTLKGESPFVLEKGSSFVDPGIIALDADGTDLSNRVTVSGTIDSTREGRYTLTYTVTDSYGDAFTITRFVDVKPGSAINANKPVISLVGSALIVVVRGSTFSDPGATAVDHSGTSITGRMQTSGAVDTDLIGTYTLTYSVSDARGNASSTTRTVRVVQEGVVVDTLSPVITLNGANPQTIALGTLFIDPGAQAEDETDGDLSDAIIVEGDVDQTTAATYTLTYTVSDAQGNTSSMTRTVVVRSESTDDTIAPVVTLVGPTPLAHALNEPFTDPGAKAEDETDGDITSAIVVSGRVDTTTIGSYILTYAATDAAGNTGIVRRTVIVAGAGKIDTIAPVITLVGAATVTLALGGTYVDAGATAVDETDGVITSRIRTTNAVETATAGTYTITYTVADNAGNSAQKERVVIVQASAGDTTRPVITLVGSNPLLLTVGDVFSDPGATARDNTDGDISAGITVSGTVNTAAAGTSTLTYSVTDNAGNTATLTRTVQVRVAGSANSLPMHAFVTGSNSETYTIERYSGDNGWTPTEIKIIIKPPEGSPAISGSVTVNGDTVTVTGEYYKAIPVPNQDATVSVTITGSFEIGLGT